FKPAAHDDRLNYTGPITLGQSKYSSASCHRCLWRLLTGFEDNYVVAIDMTKSWDWKKNISEVVINKTVAEGTSNYVPKVGSGALFHGPPNDPQIYLYGGVTSALNTSFIDYQAPTTNQYALWGFNTQTHGWTQYDVSLAAPQRPSWGASAEAPEQGMAFYLNGMISNMSSAVTASANTPPDQFGRNDSAGSTKANGYEYINKYSRRWVSKSTGWNGLHTTNRPKGCAGNRRRCHWQPAVTDSRSLVSMNQVSIFDVATIGTSNAANGWMSQTITGAAPLPRVDFCVVSVSAPDDSSFNIFLYGGWDHTKNAYYDDIWVLSLPSFTWVKIYEGVLPRLGHDCHLVGGGEATKLLPSGGWTSFQIANLFTGTSNQSAPYHVPSDNNSATPRIDNSDGGSSSTSVGAIVGGTVGGVAFLAIAVTVIYCWRRRRPRQGQPMPELAAREDTKPETAQFATAVPPAIGDPQYTPHPPNTPTSELAGTSAVNELPGEQRLAELPESRFARPWNEESAVYHEAGY
ncbi:uncharacterized protein PG986_013743, partial [Apiospora aurea]